MLVLLFFLFKRQLLIFKKIVQLLVIFFRNSTVLNVCYVSLGGSTEPPEPPLDPPQDALLKIVVAKRCVQYRLYIVYL